MPLPRLLLLARSRVVVPALALAVLGTSGAGLAAVATDAPTAPPAAAPAAVVAPVVPAAPVETVAPAPAAPVAGPAPVGPPVVAVGPLTTLVSPDLLVRVGRTISPAEMAELQDLDNLASMTLVETGALATPAGELQVLGVDPTEARGWTPPPSASSDGLWQALGRGEVVVDLTERAAYEGSLGLPVALGPVGAPATRLGGLATLGLGETDALVNAPLARSLGLAPASGVLLSTPGRSTASLTRAAKRIFGPDVAVTVLRPAEPEQASSGGKPTSYRELYVAAARTCPGLSWTVLAAIGQVESAHGRNAGVSSAGAMGPMQFLPSTWAAYAVDGDGDGDAEITDPFDAVHGAARYLCASGAGRGGDSLYKAVFAYNHADWYVRKVLDLAAQYEASAG